MTDQLDRSTIPVELTVITLSIVLFAVFGYLKTSKLLIGLVMLLIYGVYIVYVIWKDRHMRQQIIEERSDKAALLLDSPALDNGRHSHPLPSKDSSDHNKLQ